MANSAIDRLRTKFVGIVNELAKIVATLKTIRRDEGSGHFVFIGPNFYWDEPTPGQRGKQIELVRAYATVSELLKIMFRGAPEDIVREIADADKHFKTWLLLDQNWSLKGVGAENEREMRRIADELMAFFRILEDVGRRDTVLLPDTNSLLREPNPTCYRTIAGEEAFEFVLLPTVLAELDKLKTNHRNPDLREKAESAIRRIKGWRNQGNLREGVTVDKCIVVRAVHAEPDMSNTLSWLDPNTPDDRIIASAITFQSEHPAARIVLVTGDVNLQNKADAALIEVAELS